MQNRRFLKLIFLFFLVATSGFVLAKNTPSESPQQNYTSVEWQAVKLQESIENKIKRSLRPVVSEDDYVLEVKVGLDLDRAEDPTPKKKIKSVQKKKVQFSKVAFPKDGDDFVVFNKLGLEAPIVGDDAPVESEVSEAELNQKATIELNDRYNLFNFLDRVDISLTFDNGVSEKSRANIKTILDGLSFYIKDVTPQYNIQYVDLKEKKVVPPAEEAPKAVVKIPETPKKEEIVKKEQIIEERRPAVALKEDRFKNLDIMIGLIGAALILGCTAVFAATRVRKTEEKIEAQNNNINEDTVEEELKSQEDVYETIPHDEGEEMIDLTQNDAITAKINLGLERFRTVMQHHKSDTILLIKEWTKSHEASEVESLKALVQVLNDQELGDIFKLLTNDERASWKMVLDGEMTKEEVAHAFTYIGNEIIKMMMVPSLIDDYEICDLLLTLSAEEAAKYCLKYPEMGMVFTNVLSGKVISEMFKLLPHEVTVDIIERSTVYKKDEILKQMPLLKKLLTEAKASKEKPPFLQRIIDILPTAKADIERQLYMTLLSHLSVEETASIAIAVLPVEILDKLPGETFKDIMGTMTQEDQIVYLASLSDMKRTSQLERFAPTGTKVRDLLEMELNSFMDNDIQMKKLQGERRTAVIQNFLKNARTYLSRNVEAKKEIMPVMIEWLDQIKKESANAKNRIKTA